MDNIYYREAIKAALTGYEWTRAYQDTREDSDTYGGYEGGYLNGDTGIVESAAWGSGIAFANALALYLCPDSPYCNDPAVLTHAILNFEDMERNQNEDGTWDLRNSNFHDATAAAFTIEQLYPSYLLLRKVVKEHEELTFLIERLKNVFLKGGKALLSGGIHTPNHRWVISAALSYLYRETSDKRYKDEASLYLAEGIDIHEDGSFSEKSIGNYDAVVDMALLAMAENFNMPELISYVERNLTLVSRMIEPDGTLYCFSSYRQDVSMRISFSKYWRVFRRMATLTEDTRWIYTFYHLGGRNLEKINERGIEFDYLTDELIHPVREIHEESLIEIPKGTYLMNHLALARVIGDDYAITISSSSTALLHLKKGSIDMFLSIYAPFFSRGEFKADSISFQDGIFTLKKKVRYGYIRPLEEKVKSSVWEEMEHGSWANLRLFNTPGLYPAWEDIDFGKRGKVNEQELEYALKIRVAESSLEMELNVNGPSRLPYKMDFSFIPGGRISSDDIDMKTIEGNVLFAKRGEFKYKNGVDSVTVSPCFASNHADRMRGENVIDEKRFHLCLSSDRPEKRKITLCWS